MVAFYMLYKQLLQHFFVAMRRINELSALGTLVIKPYAIVIVDSFGVKRRVVYGFLSML